MKIKSFAKVFAFVLIFCILFCGLNSFLQPVWKTYNNFNTVRGFYEEPENTIETVFIGASMTANGIIPIEMYETSGICAYNLGTEQQPFFASYYWTKEAYRLHSESLKTVMLDISMLRRPYDEAFCHKALDGMKVSKNKFEAMKELEKTTAKAIARLLPVYSYHDRWESIEKNDFHKYSDEIQTYSRGYHLEFGNLLEEYNPEDISVPLYRVEPTDKTTTFYPEELEYVYKIVEFCRQEGLQQIFWKSPSAGNWSSEEAIAMQELADECGVEFVDYNLLPLIDEVGFNGALDCVDNKHLNYYGASSLSRHLGEFLVEHCKNNDVRGVDKYSYLDKQLEEYRDAIGRVVNLQANTDVTAYIDGVLSSDRYMAFLVLKDSGAKSLTEEQRRYFSSVGLTALACLGDHQSYAAVIDSGKIVYEESGVNYSVEHEGVKEDEFEYKIKSAALPFGNVASCVLDGEEYALNTRGINIVVYDTERREVVDTTCFDTYKESERLPVDLESELDKLLKTETPYDIWPDTLKDLYVYNQRCEQRRMAQ